MSRERPTRLNNEIAERYGNPTEAAPGRSTQSETKEPHAVEGEVEQGAAQDVEQAGEQDIETTGEKETAAQPLYSRPGPFASFAKPKPDDKT